MLNYTLSSEFLHAQKKAEVDPQVRIRVQELAKPALYLSDKPLEMRIPAIRDALYARGVTRVLFRRVYEDLVEKALLFTFRNALGGYRDHKRVLELAPSYSDAKLVVGVYEYIVAALPIYEKELQRFCSRQLKAAKPEGIDEYKAGSQMRRRRERALTQKQLFRFFSCGSIEYS